MKKIRDMKRPRLATIMAGLALFIVLGGSATAASGLINGKKIKKGTVTAKQIKNKTITKAKLKPALVKSLKGQQGPKGDTGANGVVSPVYAELEGVNLPASTPFGVGNVSLPAGKYMITANVKVYSTGTSVMDCKLTSGGVNSLNATWNSTENSSRATIPIQMVTGDSVTGVTLGCNAGDSPGTAAASIIATPVQ